MGLIAPYAGALFEVCWWSRNRLFFVKQDYKKICQRHDWNIVMPDQVEKDRNKEIMANGQQIPFLCNQWIHASKTRLQSREKWVLGSLSNQSYPWSQINLSTDEVSDKVRLTIEFGRGNTNEDKDLDLNTSITRSNDYLCHLRDMLSDAFDAYLYFWDMRAKFVTDTVEVTERELAEILGLAIQKNGAYHPDTRKKLDKITKMWDALKADVKISIKKKTGRGKEVTRYLKMKGRFFEQSRWEEGEEIDNVEKWSRVSWKFRIGDVLAPFLEAPNRSLAYIPRKILQYRSNSLIATKRIGRSCLYLLRSGADLGGIKVASISEILADAGVKFKDKHPRKNLEQFEDARQRLIKDQVFDSIRYESLEDEQYFKEILRGKKDQKFKLRWLEAKVVIKSLTSDNKNKDFTLNKDLHIPQAQDLVTYLTKYLAWSQVAKSELARKIGIGNSSLSMLLNQTRKPSKGNKSKIEAFLSSIEHLPYKN